MITGIGSLPFRDVDEAIDIVFSTCKEIPFWPQLPKRSKNENMYLPFVYGLPFFRMAEDGSVYMEDEAISDFERFESLIEENELQSFFIPEDFAPGFFRMLERLKEIEFGVRAIKTQITGPISMGLGIKDKKGLPVIYSDFLFGIVKKTINMKAKWMVSEIKRNFPEKEVIIFFDEPYLVAYGSPYFWLPREHLIESIKEVSLDVRAKKGIHCCGNTDWSLVLGMDVEIVNFDAFNYIENVFLYRDELVQFFLRDGMLSPGVVPSTEEIKKTNEYDIKKVLLTYIKCLRDTKGEISTSELLFTPSCGLGSLEVDDAKKAMELLKTVPEMILEVFDNKHPSC